MASSKYLTEFVGTFFLVFIIGLVSTSDQPAVAMHAPLAIGMGLVALVYMGGHISMAHYNPAVTIAFVLRGDCKVRDMVPYFIAQFSAAILAALVIAIILPGAAAQIEGEQVEAASAALFGPSPAESLGLSSVAPWVIEILFTFLLMLVIFNVAVHPATDGNQFYGIAIGFTVTAIAYAGGGISGGAFNPAVGAGPNLVRFFYTGELVFLNQILMYCLGPIAGAVLAVPVFQSQLAKEDMNEK